MGTSASRRLRLRACVSGALILPGLVVFGPPPAAHAVPGGPATVLVAAGDLDGDGLADVVAHSPYGGTRQGFRVEGRKGVDGTTLWSKYLRQPFADLANDKLSYQWAGAYPAKVGAAGANGVVVVQHAVASPDYVPVAAAVTVVTAFTGSGKQAWQRSTVGPAAAAGAYVSPVGLSVYESVGGAGLVGVADVVGGPADDVIVKLGLVGGVLRYAALDGRDGTDAWLSPPIVMPEEHAEITGDLDGDGTNDFLSYSYTSGSPFAAYSGADGSLLWLTTGLSVRYGLERAGDMTGDGREDLYGRLYPEYGRYGYQGMTVVDGATGAVLYSGGSGQPSPIGDVDGDGIAEIGMASSVGSGTSYATRYQAVRSDGSVVYSTEHPGGSGGYGTFAGDVDADGTGDWIHSHGGTTRSVISGRDGSMMWNSAGDYLPDPLHASLDGNGDDMFGLPIFGPAVAEAFDGRTGAKLWASPLPATGRRYMVERQSTGDLDGDGLPEVIVNYEVQGSLDGPYTDLAHVFRGTDGAMLWSAQA